MHKPRLGISRSVPSASLPFSSSASLSFPFPPRPLPSLLLHAAACSVAPAPNLLHSKPTKEVTLGIASHSPISQIFNKQSLKISAQFTGFISASTANKCYDISTAPVSASLNQGRLHFRGAQALIKPSYTFQSSSLLHQLLLPLLWNGTIKQDEIANQDAKLDGAGENYLFYHVSQVGHQLFESSTGDLTHDSGPARRRTTASTSSCLQTDLSPSLGHLRQRALRSSSPPPHKAKFTGSYPHHQPRHVQHLHQVYPVLDCVYREPFPLVL